MDAQASGKEEEEAQMACEEERIAGVRKKEEYAHIGVREVAT